MQSLKSVKTAIAVYFWLLLLEGVFRKWILPQFSDEFFIIRDPVVIVIYLLAWQARVFPFRLSLVVLGLFAVASLVFAVQNDVPIVVTLFGIRTDFLHIPLIFVMAEVLDRDDLLRYGRWTMIASIPIIFLMWLQFRSSPDAWVNVGVRGAEGAQLRGAMGRIRPPGPFSFVTGVVSYFALSASFVFHGWLQRGTYSRRLLWFATIAIALAIPISISRSLLFSVLVVAAFGFVVTARELKKVQAYIGPLVAGVALLGLISDTAIMQTYQTRWTESIESSGGGFTNNVLGRFADEFSQPFELATSAPLFGHGIGMGTVAGARLMTGKYTFLLAESELARNVLELGPLLGFAYIGWRAWLVIVMIRRSWESVIYDGRILGWLLTGASFLAVLDGQWGPATSLGFAVFVAGLALAASNPPTAEDG